MLVKKIRTIVLIVAGFCAHSTPSGFAADNRLSNAQAEERLNYLVSVRSFTKSKPLSQPQIMRLVLTLAQWGKFPKRYIQQKQGAIPECDEYITRPDARRFTNELIGRELQEWSLMGQKFMPKMAGDKLGWWYNTGNTMYELPYVHITNRKADTQRLVTLRFDIFHRIGNKSNNPPLTKVGSGTAALESVRNNWVVISWRVIRNRHWVYNP